MYVVFLDSNVIRLPLNMLEVDMLTRMNGFKVFRAKTLMSSNIKLVGNRKENGRGKRYQ
jgi:hypothetical protein